MAKLYVGALLQADAHYAQQKICAPLLLKIISTISMSIINQFGLAFAGIGPGPPLFAATIPQCQWAAPGAFPSSSLQTPSGSLFQSFRQRFRSPDASQPAGGASGSNDSQPGILPLHTSDGVMPGGMPGSKNEPTLARASLRSPFADWNPATGLANDTNQRPGSLELASARSGTGKLAASDNIV